MRKFSGKKIRLKFPGSGGSGAAGYFPSLDTENMIRDHDFPSSVFIIHESTDIWETFSLHLRQH